MFCGKPIACGVISFAAGFKRFDGFSGFGEVDSRSGRRCQRFGGIHAGVEAFGHFVHPAAAPGIRNAAATCRPKGKMADGGLGRIFDHLCAGAPADFFLEAQRILIVFALESDPNARLGTIAVAIAAVVLPQSVDGEKIIAREVANILINEIASIELSACFEHEGGGDSVGFFPVSAAEEVLQGAVVEEAIGFQGFDRGLGNGLGGG